MVSEPVIAAIVGAFMSGESLRQFAAGREVILILVGLENAKLGRHFAEDALEELNGGKIKA